MAGIDRRTFLAGSAASLAANVGAIRAASAASIEEPPLKEIARSRGIVYGTTVAGVQLFPGDDFTSLVAREAAAIVPENEMKWFHMSETADQTDYLMADRMVGFAGEHGLRFRGHNLLWFWRTPYWFEKLPDRASAEAAMLQRIADMAGRYRGKVDSWDVVNEPVNPMDERTDNLRKAVFLEQIGPEYLDLAYHAAREADPAARLVLNEYDVEYDTPDMDRKRSAVLRVLERMRKAGTPVDALGVEAHLSIGVHPFSEKKLRAYLAEAAQMGVEIQITELDCTDERAPADIAKRDQLVADEYRRFLEVALDEPAVKMLMTWGLSDRHSWIVRHETNDEKWRRDGLGERPLPFDRDLRRKPAWQVLAETLRAAPARPMSPDRAGI